MIVSVWFNFSVLSSPWPRASHCAARLPREESRSFWATSRYYIRLLRSPDYAQTTYLRIIYDQGGLNTGRLGSRSSEELSMRWRGKGSRSRARSQASTNPLVDAPE